MNDDSIVIAAGTQAMEFPAADPLTGREYSAAEQFQQRLQNRTWVNEATVPGTPAHAEFNRLTLQQAAEADEVSGSGTVNPSDLAYELRGYGLTEQQVVEEMRRLGVAPERVPGLGQTRPEQFRIPYKEPLTEPEQFAADKSARGWLVNAGFDADSGSNFASDVNKLVERNWDEASLSSHMEHGRKVLRDVWAGDFENNVALIGRFIDDIEGKAPGLNEFLHEFPMVLTDPMIAHELLGLARKKYSR